MPRKKPEEPKEKKVGLFDVVGELSFGKTNLLSEDCPDRADALKAYNPFMVNRAFSFHVSSLLDASIMNQCASLEKDMQFAYYLHALRKEKRFSAWPKTVHSDDLKLVSEVYGVNYHKAEQYLKLLNEKQLEALKNAHNTGGKQ